jgi:hypothetical protein
MQRKVNFGNDRSKPDECPLEAEVSSDGVDPGKMKNAIKEKRRILINTGLGVNAGQARG